MPPKTRATRKNLQSDASLLRDLEASVSEPQTTVKSPLKPGTKKKKVSAKSLKEKESLPEPLSPQKTASDAQHSACNDEGLQAPPNTADTELDMIRQTLQVSAFTGPRASSQPRRKHQRGPSTADLERETIEDGRSVRPRLVTATDIQPSDPIDLTGEGHEIPPASDAEPSTEPSAATVNNTEALPQFIESSVIPRQRAINISVERSTLSRSSSFPSSDGISFLESDTGLDPGNGSNRKRGMRDRLTVDEQVFFKGIRRNLFEWWFSGKIWPDINEINVYVRRLIMTTPSPNLIDQVSSIFLDYRVLP